MERVMFAALLLFAPAGSTAAELPPDSIELVLAASWQPGFCATAAGRGKIECRTLTADRFDATHFALHGLWPDDLDDTEIFPCYCDGGGPMDCRESRPTDRRTFVSDGIFEELRIVMPGVRSNLHRYEWTKHGSCYEDDKSGADNNADPDEYFTEALALMAQLNSSPVQALFAGHIDGTLTRGEIEAVFDEAFGAGAGKRVIVRCAGSVANRNIVELWVSLKGDVTPQSDLASLILAAPPTSTSANDTSCAGGRVKEVAS